MIFNPSIEGTTSIRTSGQEFLSAFRRRVEKGLLHGQPHPRSRYVVTETTDRRLHVSASDWWTAINVGLNEIDLQTSDSGRLSYSVRYWRWAAYALGLGAILAVIMLAVFLGLDLRRYIEEHPGSSIPGLSIDQQVGIAWVMVVFWGLVWPWLLIAFHKRPVRRLLEQLIADVDAGTRTAAEFSKERSEG